MSSSAMDLPDRRPARKVVAASTTTAVTAFVLWLIAVVPDPDVVPPAPVVGLVVVVVPAALSFAAGYFTRRAPREVSLPPPDRGTPGAGPSV